MTLDSTPAVGQGSVRVWYLYAMSTADAPNNLEVAPIFVKEERSAFLDTRFLNAALNLSDLASASTARTNLGFTSQTAGRVLFGDGGTTFTSDADLFWDNSNNRLGVNQGTPGAGATLDVGGITGGVGLPVVTTVERDALTPARNGVILYNSSLHRFDGYINGAWGAVGVTDHGALTGLTDDDHTQYALLLGRAAGQTLIGGTASGDDLVLQSTSHGTKGSVIIANQTGETTTIGPIGSLTANNTHHILFPNTNSQTNGLVISSNESSWGATLASASPSGWQLMPHDSGGSLAIKASAPNDSWYIYTRRPGDGSSQGYFQMGNPNRFMNGGTGNVVLQISGTNGQTADLTQWSDQNDNGRVVATVGPAGQMRASVGTVLLPSLSFEGDDNTGLANISADTIQVCTGGVERARFSSAGLVLGLAGTTTGALGISGSTSGVVTLNVNATAGTYSLTLPAAQGGANQALVNDGAGALSWRQVPATKAGVVTLAISTTSKAITFATARANANYTPVFTIYNGTDPDPIGIPVRIIAIAASGFTAEWDDALDTGNYSGYWAALEHYDP